MKQLSRFFTYIDNILDKTAVPAFFIGALFGAIFVEADFFQRQFIDEARLCSEFFSPEERLPVSQFGGDIPKSEIQRVKQKIAEELQLSGTNSAVLYCRNLILR
jgi:hypothetical protein